MRNEYAKSIQRLNVTLLTTSFPLASSEMSGVFVKHLVEAMPAWINVTVVAPAPDYPTSSSSSGRYSLRLYRYAPMKLQTLAHKSGGIPVALKKSPLAWLLLPGFITSMCLVCLWTARHADVIHANWSVNGIVAGLVGWLLGKPVVTTLRGSDISFASRSKPYAWTLGYCMRLSDKLLTVSHSIHRTLVDEFPQYQSKILFIPNGVEEGFLSIARNGSGLASNIAVVGNLTKNKCVESVINALKRLTEESGLHLHIIGDGPERPVLENLASTLGVSHIVRFTGKLPQEAIINILRQMDIFVLASFSEGRPNALVEAMAAGLPIIASNIDGVRELIEDGVNGLLFEPGNAEQLASQIRRLCKDGELRDRLSRQARQYIIDAGLSWPATARQYAGIYQSLVA